MRLTVRVATAVVVILLGMGTASVAQAVSLGSAPPIVPVAKKGCYVTASSATVRSRPSSNSTAVGMAYKGDRCAVKQSDTKWTKLRMKGGPTGWVATRLLHTPDEDVHMNLNGPGM